MRVDAKGRRAKPALLGRFVPGLSRSVGFDRQQVLPAILGPLIVEGFPLGLMAPFLARDGIVHRGQSVTGRTPGLQPRAQGFRDRASATARSRA